jgi:phosphatidate cytidylyltransferase
MATRLATGLILAPLIIWLVLAGPTWGVLLFLGAAGVLAAYELFAMAMPGRRLEIAAGVVMVALLLSGVAMGLGVIAPGPRGSALSPENVMLFAALVFTCGPGFVVLARPRPLDQAGNRLMAMYGGTAFIAGTFAFVLALGTSPPALMVSFAIVWLGDTGAYFAGRAFGRHKLYELISPKKTIEGAVGGLAASVLGAWGMAAWLYPTLEPWRLFMAAIVGGVIAQCGDLVESAFKRAYGVKDSGKLLPGHGGVFDRLDGFLFAAPVLASLLL